MARLETEDVLKAALEIQFTSPKTLLCFHISADEPIVRDSLRFLHNYTYTKDGVKYNFPLYQYHDKLYIHTDPLAPLGDGYKLGRETSSGNWYFSPLQK